MYKLCKTEQSATRQRALEKGLLAAISVRRYDELSVSDLCAQMGIPRKSFYRYFSSKEGALHALLDHTLMDFEGYHVPEKGENRTLHRDVSHFFEFWLGQRALLDALERNGLSSLLIERSIVYALSGSAMPRRFLPQDDPTTQTQVVIFTVCGLMSLMINWHRSGFQTPIPKMADVAVRVLCQPLFPNVAELI